MITHANGVVEFESYDEWINAELDYNSAYIYPNEQGYSEEWGVDSLSTGSILCGEKQDALDIAGWFAARGKSAWTSVKDKLPDEGVRVLLAVGDKIAIAKYVVWPVPPHTPMFGLDSGHTIHPNNVDSWMPLPAVHNPTDPLALNPEHPEDCVAGGTRFCEKGCKMQGECKQ